MLGQAKARSQKLHSGLPCVLQELKYLSYDLLLCQMHIGRRLEKERVRLDLAFFYSTQASQVGA